MKRFALATVLLLAASGAFAQATATPAPAPASAASMKTKHQFLKKLKARKPASSAVNPEASADKKGGA